MAIAADSFADGPDLLAVRPCADPRFAVGCDVGTRYCTWQAKLPWENESPAAAGFDRRPAEARFVVLGVAAIAIQQMLEEVLSAGNAFGSHFHLHVARRRHSGLPK